MIKLCLSFFINYHISVGKLSPKVSGNCLVDESSCSHASMQTYANFDSKKFDLQINQRCITSKAFYFQIPLYIKPQSFCKNTHIQVKIILSIWRKSSKIVLDIKINNLSMFYEDSDETLVFFS